MDKTNLTLALCQYQKGKITLGKAAELAGYPLRVMIKLAATKKILFQYSLENLKQDFKAAQR